MERSQPKRSTMRLVKRSGNVGCRDSRDAETSHRSRLNAHGESRQNNQQKDYSPMDAVE